VTSATPDYGYLPDITDHWLLPIILLHDRGTRVNDLPRDARDSAAVGI